MSEATRAYIYRLFVALIPVLVVLGFALPGNAEMWLNLVAVILGFGSSALASLNTKTTTFIEDT